MVHSDPAEGIVGGKPVNRAPLIVLVRHGQSELNQENRFAGWSDPELTSHGVDEARRAGRRLNSVGLAFDRCFSSSLKRAHRTAAIMLEELGQRELSISCNQALNERDYGELSGLNKDEARTRWGAKQVQSWRRSYDTRPPAGESLKDTVERVLPYYCANILPAALRGERVLVVAHGSSLRAMVMTLDHHTPESMCSLEFATGVPLIYRLNTDSTVIGRERLV